LHKNQNLTADDADHTDLHGSKKFKPVLISRRLLARVLAFLIPGHPRWMFSSLPSRFSDQCHPC